MSATLRFTKDHLNLYKNYNQLKKENDQLRNKIFESDYLILENTQLRKLIDEQVESSSNLISSRVMLDKQSPYLNSFVIKSGANHKIKNGMAVLDGKNFIGRIVDVNFFSSRVLLISDLNSKISVIVEPSGNHAILSGRGGKELTLEYLPENHTVKDGDKIFIDSMFPKGSGWGTWTSDEKRNKAITVSYKDEGGKAYQDKISGVDAFLRLVRKAIP